MPASDSTYCDVIEKMSRDYDALKAHADALADAADNAVEDACEYDACNLLRDALDAYRKWQEEGK